MVMVRVGERRRSQVVFNIEPAALRERYGSPAVDERYSVASVTRGCAEPADREISQQRREHKPRPRTPFSRQSCRPWQRQSLNARYVAGGEGAEVPRGSQVRLAKMFERVNSVAAGAMVSDRWR